MQNNNSNDANSNDDHKENDNSSNDETEGREEGDESNEQDYLEDQEEEEFDELYSIFKGIEENETRVFDILKTQGYSLAMLKADDWAFYKQCRDFGYTIDPLVHALMTDNDDELQVLSSSPNFEIEAIIDPSLFSRSDIFQVFHSVTFIDRSLFNGMNPKQPAHIHKQCEHAA